jgi:hypothetical protein
MGEIKIYEYLKTTYNIKMWHNSWKNIHIYESMFYNGK